MGKDLKLVADRMVPPDPGPQFLAPGIRSSGPADATIVEDPWIPYSQPSGPHEVTVQALMGVLKSKAVQQHARRGIRHVVLIGIGQKQQLGCGTHPDPAMAHREAADEVEPLGKHPSGLEPAVPVTIGQNHQPILTFARGPPGRVTVRLGDPEAPSGIPCQSNRLVHLGLRGHQIHAKPFGHMHARHGLLRSRHRGPGDRIGTQRPEHPTGLEPLGARLRFLGGDTKDQAETQGEREPGVPHPERLTTGSGEHRGERKPAGRGLGSPRDFPGPRETKRPRLSGSLPQA